MSSTTPSIPEGRQLPTRVGKACDRCRRNKSRCDPFRPCSLCVRANIECSISNVHESSRVFKRRRTEENPRSTTTQEPGPAQDIHETPPIPRYETSEREIPNETSMTSAEAVSAMGIAQRIYELGSHPQLKRPTSAIPGGEVDSTNAAARRDRSERHLVASILQHPLPGKDIIRMLLEEYFDSVHWFSLVIYEPRFRTRLMSVEDGFAYPAQQDFLLLLSIVLGIAAWYKSHKDEPDADFPDEDWRAWSLSLFQNAESQLVVLLDCTSITSIQTCILLGSYYVYHGKPNLSFALLGATIRSAQALGLHRQPPSGELETVEERKRVWWTIYTWDRFASVTYGRPLGINDRDCNVAQPIDISESPCFKADATLTTDTSICYSSYQRELNKLYVIASSIIDILFGIRVVDTSAQYAETPYTARIVEVTERLWTWRRRLPTHLILDLNSDSQAHQNRMARVYRLQALSLHLTFDNLLIIFHRPFLSQQIEHLIRNHPESATDTQSPTNPSNAGSSPTFQTNAPSPMFGATGSSTEQWWDAALRTSKVTGMPQLVQLATNSHLIAFLAINLFNSAIVMAVLALSEPLSNQAQEAKRMITRIFRLQEVLGKRTQLSVQSNIVLRDVIQMLLRREADAMLAPVTAPEIHQAEQPLSSTANPVISVEDILRLPMQSPLAAVSNQFDGTRKSMATSNRHLNESLASVQRVFPAGIDGTNNIERVTHTELHRDNPDDWLYDVGQQPEIEDTSIWADNPSGLNPATSGLYWFWDSAWQGN